MATDLKNGQDQSVTSLVSGIMQDAQELLKQQFELFKHEVRTDIRKIEAGLQVMGTGLAFGIVAAFLLGIAICLGLQAIWPGLALWACFAIGGGLFAGIGGALLVAGWSQLHAVNPLPDKTAEALKENVQWITNPK
jgi:hypothetical protein